MCIDNGYAKSAGQFWLSRCFYAEKEWTVDIYYEKRYSKMITRHNQMKEKVGMRKHERVFKYIGCGNGSDGNAVEAGERH